MGDEKKSPKDIWDRLEILGKVTLPLVVAGGGLFLNQEISRRQAATEELKIAISILNEPLETPVTSEDGLRRWAGDRLKEQYDIADPVIEELVKGRQPFTLVQWRPVGPTSLPLVMVGAGGPCDGLRAFEEIYKSCLNGSMAAEEDSEASDENLESK